MPSMICLKTDYTVSSPPAPNPQPPTSQVSHTPYLHTPHLHTAWSLCEHHHAPSLGKNQSSPYHSKSFPCPRGKANPTFSGTQFLTSPKQISVPLRNRHSSERHATYHPRHSLCVWVLFSQEVSHLPSSTGTTNPKVGLDLICFPLLAHYRR